MGYTYEDLTISTLLKVDVNSQRFTIQSGNKETPLVNNEQFWGKGDGDGLYFHYSSDKKSSSIRTYKGIHNSHLARKLKGTERDVWINDNILNGNTNRLCIVQGYAGCGKTTFVNKILRDVTNPNQYFTYSIENYYNFYEGYSKDTEEYFISNSIQVQLCKYIVSILKKNNGMAVFDTFIELFDDNIRFLSPVLEINFISVFQKKGTLYNIAQKINKCGEKCSAQDIKDFTTQFLGMYNGKLWSLSFNHDRNNKIQIKEFVRSKLDILLCIDYLWRCAVSLNIDEHTHYVVYDNLDIIENSKIISNFYDTIRHVIGKYNRFKMECRNKILPTFIVVLPVRIITFSAFSQFIEVPESESEASPADVYVCDISNLYSYTEVLNHRLKVLKTNLTKFLPKKSKNFIKIKDSLDKISAIPNEILKELKYSDLLNHNFRAGSNLLEKIIQNPTFVHLFPMISDLKLGKSLKYSLVLHIICSILKSQSVLEELGYNLCDQDNKWIPTTLSRLILTYLNNIKTGFVDNVPIQNKPSSADVSFVEIIQVIDRIPFLTRNQNESLEDNLIYLEQNNSVSDNQETIIKMISNMMKRNNHDQNEGIELWRRPLYYTRNGIPPSNSKTEEEFLQHLRNQVNFPSGEYTHFCITDEGSTFIEKIATHFEFYSVRYNSNMLPIYFIKDFQELDECISKVFIQVKNCVRKQLWFMNFYIDKYNVKKNAYLNKWFHPRTVEFAPQLHIVRTIYDHIIYLSEYRDYICNNQMDKNLNLCIVKWIGNYLELYRQNLYDVLNNTDAVYNNKVWLDLKYLYWLVFNDKEKKGVNFISNEKTGFVSISRRFAIKRENQSEDIYTDYRITDKELLETPMLITTNTMEHDRNLID